MEGRYSPSHFPRFQPPYFRKLCASDNYYGTFAQSSSFRTQYLFDRASKTASAITSISAVWIWFGISFAHASVSSPSAELCVVHSKPKGIVPFLDSSSITMHAIEFNVMTTYLSRNTHFMYISLFFNKIYRF